MRYAAILEYHGCHYAGYQWQSHALSVQHVLEEALSKIADTRVQTICAGRTDAGVHATHQVVHFDCAAVRHDRAWRLGGNSHLPHDVSIRWAGRVSDDFHARFSATARRYRYLIWNDISRSAHTANAVTVIPDRLDVAAMRCAARHFLGEQDFSAVRAASCQSLTAWRNIHALDVTQAGSLIVIDIAANAFLHHMVRNIVGVLLAVGRGELGDVEVLNLLRTKQRERAPATAPADGLYLVGVRYPARWLIPTLPPGPFFLP